LQKVPVARLGMNAIKNSRVRPISPYYSDMSPRIAQAFNQVLEGKMTGEKAVERLQRELQAILQMKR
jgi:multiple sugar transport system substrate-binding protein